MKNLSKPTIQYIINGENFKTIDEFFKEMNILFGNEYTSCENPSDFENILKGGFGRHSYNQPIKIIWINSKISKINFGYEQTIKILNLKLKNCDKNNKQRIKRRIEDAKNNIGKTIFDEIVEFLNSLKKEGLNITLEIY